MCVRSPAAAERRLQGRKVIFFLVTKAGNRAAPDLLGCGADFVVCTHQASLITLSLPLYHSCEVCRTLAPPKSNLTLTLQRC